MPISILPAPHALTALVQFGYPALRYMEKVKTGQSMTDTDYVLFTVYFVICALWMFLESAVLWILVDYCPFFLEIKLLFFLWLMYPEYKGAAYLWDDVLKPLHKKLDDQHYEKIMGALQKAKLPPVPESKSATEVSDKNEVMRELLTSKK
mmetsp:Transcript_89742/g.159521  ORF Transcript_89742/g.159521 Transcript_89742/m.159521 type:complete len:150 (+) Transcript_89742:80-529(+)|eukprot:CAMPEP_0197660130 /NCGR_PEP_ID=MMETSP1338-20131121/50627_1 /TAXON_ID=43686 ORGANISM="Pelagodinium beii, Strain RCC1491" /NCGR_SAMPLE_ID=MMETSP1338 /ASSEMBLY_ACC=CAM_ASM_000754 /LENGTH=149 /DNA_ID=CAMNT_0043237411 /DNA_START=69 /DNA_END=518 /DNA_ORIENTATION=+